MRRPLSLAPACLTGLLLAIAFPSIAPAQEASPIGATAPNSATADPAQPGVSQDTLKPTALAKPVFETGLAEFRATNFAAAAEKFEEAAGAKESRRAFAYAWLARADLHLNKVEDAENAALKAVELAPNLSATQSAFAEVLFRQGKFPEAEAILRKLAQEKNGDGRTFLTLARIYWVTANNKTAKADIEIARQYDPLDPDIYRYWMATLPQKERLEQLKRELASGVDRDQEERESLQGRIAVLEAQEKQPGRPCKLTGRKFPAEIKLDKIADSRRLFGYGLQLKINNVSSTLLIDTGAGGILINSRMAERAGVRKILNQKIGGIGDKDAASGYLGFADKLELGGLVFENCYVDVLDKRTSANEDGLVGMDVFQDFLVDLDFPNQRLRLSELPPFSDQASVNPSLNVAQSENAAPLHDRYIPAAFSRFEQVYRIGHLLLIPGKINDSPPKLFLIDTGAFDNAITPAAAKGIVKIHDDEESVVKGLNGRMNRVYFTGRVTLTFGGFQQPRDDLTVFDLSHVSEGAGAEISGLLGFAMLYLLEIKIDYRDQLVEFSYNPNRFH